MKQNLGIILGAVATALGLVAVLLAVVILIKVKDDNVSVAAPSKARISAADSAQSRLEKAWNEVEKCGDKSDDPGDWDDCFDDLEVDGVKADTTKDEKTSYDSTSGESDSEDVISDFELTTKQDDPEGGDQVQYKVAGSFSFTYKDDYERPSIYLSCEPASIHNAMCEQGSWYSDIDDEN